MGKYKGRSNNKLRGSCQTCIGRYGRMRRVKLTRRRSKKERSKDISRAFYFCNRLDGSRLLQIEGSNGKKICFGFTKRWFFSLVRQSGSHKIFRHPDGKRVTLSYHKGSQTFPQKLLKIMIEEQAKWSEDDLERLGLTG
ncbi:MAG: addiction module toxin, HicA family [Thermoplasmata archaeon]|nr:MAG: addiction module toxin, HicA family [Thermoplasmata archaeon]